MFKEPLILSQEFKSVLDMIENGSSHVFLTGRAGTGKSTLLRMFRDTTQKKIAVLAPTGVAALLVQGQTIHSFFRFAPRLMSQADIKPNWAMKEVIKKLDILIIDEISMVRADVMDNINYSLQITRKNYKPFGGVRMLMIGDLFQLPPVVSNEEQAYIQERYSTPFFFSAAVFREPGLDFQMAELRTVFRQESRHFLQLLEGVRTNDLDQDAFQDLNQRHLAETPIDQPGYITLAARNATADQINKQRLDSLVATEQVYYGKVEGEFNPSIFPVENELRLREGAQVMFTRNDGEEGKYVNGTIGIVRKLGAEEIIVEVEDSKGEPLAIKVTKSKWETIKYKIDPAQPDSIKADIVGSYLQYPVKLAWAITIHKAQGKTFDKIILDLGSGAFENGQVYVALSRSRTLEGIVLRTPLRPRDIMTDQRVLEFYDGMR
jgi:ATP-dependent DNA helicase PIF1